MRQVVHSGGIDEHDGAERRQFHRLGVSETMDTRCPVRALIREDLPAFRLPKNPICSRSPVMVLVVIRFLRQRHPRRCHDLGGHKFFQRFFVQKIFLADEVKEPLIFPCRFSDQSGDGFVPQSRSEQRGHCVGSIQMIRDRLCVGRDAADGSRQRGNHHLQQFHSAEKRVGDEGEELGKFQVAFSGRHRDHGIAADDLNANLFGRFQHDRIDFSRHDR